MTDRDLVRGSLADVLLAVRGLLDAVAMARPDGSEFAALARSGRLRIVIDERGGFLTIGLAGEREGDPVRWLETLSAVPADDATFGLLHSAVKATTPLN